MNAISRIYMLNAALEMAQHYRNSVANSDLRTRRR